TLLAEIVRLVEAAEQGRARYVVLADKVARLYAPAVHGLAALTFVGWLVFSQIGWEIALLNAIAVLIITCPCALGLAVPVVQVIASGRLMRDGILLKSATALERFARVDMVVFDKTGTLTLGRPELVDGGDYSPSDLACAAAMAVSSRHPLSRAIIAAAPSVVALEGVREVPGAGLEAPDGTRLGNRHFVGVAEADGEDSSFNPELWLVRSGADPVCFTFHDSLREDGEEILKKLKSMELPVSLLSGDRPPVAAALAGRLGIEDWQAGCSPADKVARLSQLEEEGRHVLMVGDGLNDAPALTAAFVSLSPSSAADISQNAADAVFQGARLAPVTETLAIARKADRLVKQNFGLAFAYNIVTIPLAMAGLVTPLIAAAAMSASSLVVIGNALRLGKRRRA
ncbi:MAG: heavy metal translocating P-type ATPase, partial [Rhodospirillaceae bacterium]|nr:heavy metal translocating P-type ATPase [Rhodospirillaceae bacterium]